MRSAIAGLMDARPGATLGAATSSTTDYEQYAYDSVGNRTSLRKRDGKTITYIYDALNRVRRKTVPVSTIGGRLKSQDPAWR
jgi:YD repeat-containing protein